jgi:hypothetical protein
MRPLTRALALLAAPALSLGLLSAPDAPAQAQPGRAAAPMVTTPGSFTGYAFDACDAPTQAQMNAWRAASPYSAVGVYIGGVSRLCEQQQLSAAWVRTQVRLGWRILPIQVGPQASCSDHVHRMSDDLPTAKQQGRDEADLAVANAQALAIGPGSTLYYDLEDYDIGPDQCRWAALTFMSGWTQRLHERGYVSGVYSNLGAAITSLDLADRVSHGSYVMPDEIWFAWENGKADAVTDHRVQSSRWNSHARIHQYDLDTTRTYGGVTLDIDLNWVDVGNGSVAPAAKPMCRGVDVDLHRYPTRKKGHRGEAVEAARCLLRKQGFTKDKPSGRFDGPTAKAVRKAQRKLRLPVSGKLTRPTWTALLARGTQPLLKVGAVGDPARRVQRALTSTLGTRVPVTGVVDQRTASYVAAFQRREKLPATGLVDAATWTRLVAGG